MYGVDLKCSFLQKSPFKTRTLTFGTPYGSRTTCMPVFLGRWLQKFRTPILVISEPNSIKAFLTCIFSRHSIHKKILFCNLFIIILLMMTDDVFTKELVMIRFSGFLSMEAFHSLWKWRFFSQSDMLTKTFISLFVFALLTTNFFYKSSKNAVISQNFQKVKMQNYYPFIF